MARPVRRIDSPALRATLAALALLGMARAAAHEAQGVPVYGAREDGPPVRLENADGDSPYTGIGRYLGRASCTAVFVTTSEEGTGSRSAPAYALTNGHCPDFPASNDVLVDQPPGRGQVTFNYFADTGRSQLTVPVVRNVYVTMKGRDLAVLELAWPYDRLRANGIEPRVLTRGRPDASEPIAIVGAPGSSFLQLAACRLDGQAPLVLEHTWFWYDLFRNTCAGIAPGSSGSPVLSRRTGAVIGLANTTTSGGRTAFTECIIDHPCEPVPGGETGQVDTTYVTPVLGLDACFPGGWFDLRAAGCPLDPGAQVRLSPSYLGRVNPSLDSVPLGRPARTWNVTVSGSFPSYRFKVAAAAVDDCRDPRGYAPARAVARQPVIDEPLPTREGWWFLCVLGGVDARNAGGWQSAAFPTAVRVRIDTVRPRVAAPLSIQDVGPSWQVRFDTLDPEIASYTYKFGRPADTRCEDDAGYRPTLIPFISIPKSGRPYVFCAIPYDSAFNRGRLIEELLP